MVTFFSCLLRDFSIPAGTARRLWLAHWQTAQSAAGKCNLGLGADFGFNRCGLLCHFRHHSLRSTLASAVFPKSPVPATVAECFVCILYAGANSRRSHKRSPNGTEYHPMSAGHSSHGRRWLQTAVIVTAVFASYAYFYQAGGWNQNSRFDLVRAILDEHTLRIDSYHINTEDKAVFRGHYYSDKAPGVALFAVPGVAASRPVLRLLGVDPQSPRGLLAQSYVAAVAAVCLPSALAAGCLFLVAQKLGSSPPAGLFAALSMALATPIWA